MVKGFSVCKIKGHNKYRGKAIVDKHEFVKYFDGNKKDAEAQCKGWKEKLVADLKDRYDGAKSWLFFKMEFLGWLKKNKSRYNTSFQPRTIQEHTSSLKKVEKILRPRFMPDINVGELGKLKTALEKEALAKNVGFHGANKVLVNFKTALAWGIERGYVPDMSLNVVKLLSVPRVVVKIFTPRMISLMLKYSNTKWRVAILLGFDSGCRPEEVYSMLVSKLDLENGFAWISPNVENKALGITAWNPKAGKTRQIRLTQRTIEEIKKLNPKGPYLITNQRNEPFTEFNFSNTFKKHLQGINNRIKADKENGPEPIHISGTFKLLRKSYCTTRQGEGADLEDVSDSMGHADSQVTQEHYTSAEYAVLKEKQIQQERARLKELDKYIVPLEYKENTAGTANTTN